MKKALPYILTVLALFAAGGIYIDITSSGQKAGPKAPLGNSFTTAEKDAESANSNNKALKKIKLGNFGKAPEFSGIYKWLNSDALTMAKLKGKVVLIDFWTYSCINCIRTLPYVTKWYDTYRNESLVVVGVHTPEFPFEKITDNVATAIKRFKINYPVAQDNDYKTWNGYSNQYWPAEYLIDKNGDIVYTHFGEGDYDKTEEAIKYLLGQGVYDLPAAKGVSFGRIGSPEMYFGAARLQHLSPGQSPSPQPTIYQLPAKLALNQFALEGQWQFTEDRARLTRGPGKIKLHFSSGKVFMVAAAQDKPITIKITVDGQAQPDIAVGMSDLYILFDSNDYAQHVVEIEIPESGFEAYTFTFG